MRLARKVGLAVLAAMVATAIVNASAASASSTALCKKHQEPCSAANTYQGHFEAVTANPKFLTSLGDVSCNKGRILGFALGLASPQTTHLEALTFNEDCLTAGGFECVVESTELGLLLILRTELNLASGTMDNTRVLISCPGIAMHCVFDMGTELHVTGSPNQNSLAEIHAIQAPLEVAEGMFCPEEVSLDALYKIVQPDPIAITK
jgi:hypothetical protein